jgi:tetratricopeptide (TPR) repeat protein
MNQQKETARASTEITELQDASDFIRNYGSRILWSAVIILSVITATIWYYHSTQKKEEKASRELFSARSLQELEEIAEKYDTGRIAPVALLKLAKAYFNVGNYALAQEKYTEFLRRFPKHEMKGMAELGKINSIEAMGKIEEAKSLYSEFISKYPDHPEILMAQIGYARCLEQLGNYKDAYSVYTGIISNSHNPQIISYIKYLAEPTARQLGIDISKEGSIVTNTVANPEG